MLFRFRLWIAGIQIRFWSKFHPCRIGWNEYDHDWYYEDDSFSHEFGTELCGHWECKRCGEEPEEQWEAPIYDWEDY